MHSGTSGEIVFQLTRLMLLQKARFFVAPKSELGEMGVTSGLRLQ